MSALRPSGALNPCAAVLCAVFLSFFLASCGGPKKAQVQIPAPPPMATVPPVPTVPAPPQKTGTQTRAQIPAQPGNIPAQEKSPEVISVPSDAKPISTQTGLASWYGPPYHNRRSSNGEIYDMHGMTAAHCTLPLGSIVRVTNLKTGHSALVRITDRGPFIPGRVIDLSLAAAQQVDVWRAGVAKVLIEVMETPTPLNADGRWAVQIGAFDNQVTANSLADHLTRRYRTAKVLCFSSPVGDWWVRVRVLSDDRKRAEEVRRDTQTSQGTVFLVRLD